MIMMLGMVSPEWKFQFVDTKKLKIEAKVGVVHVGTKAPERLVVMEN